VCYNQGRVLPIEWFYTFIAVGFINVGINPFIYAGRYDVFKKSLRRMLKKDDHAVVTIAVQPQDAVTRAVSTK